MLYPFGPKSQDAKAQYKNFVIKAQKEDPPKGKKPAGLWPNHPAVNLILLYAANQL